MLMRVRASTKLEPQWLLFLWRILRDGGICLHMLYAVLGSFLSTLNIFCTEAYSTRHELHEFYVYDFIKVHKDSGAFTCQRSVGGCFLPHVPLLQIWNCSQAEANERVHAFFDSPHFTDGIPPIPGAWEALQRLKQHCHLVVVT